MEILLLYTQSHILSTEGGLKPSVKLRGNLEVVVEHAGDFPSPPAMPPKEVEAGKGLGLRMGCVVCRVSD